MGRQHVWILVLVLAQACDCGGNPFSRPCDTEADCAEDETCVDNVCALPQSTECGGACTASEVCMDDVCVEQPDGCIDLDGDGSGEMCLRPDCDDNDPIQTGVERCDGRDNDCDGVVDNGVLSACGDCDAQCQTGGGIGAGGEMPFMPSDENADGVEIGRAHV